MLRAVHGRDESANDFRELQDLSTPSISKVTSHPRSIFDSFVELERVNSPEKFFEPETENKIIGKFKWVTLCSHQ